MKLLKSLPIALGLATLALTSSGCITFTKHAIPANRLPNQFAAPSKSDLLPINFAILGGNKAAEHLLDTGDVVAVTVQGVIPEDTKDLPPIINGTQMTLNAVYYPPLGAVNARTSVCPCRCKRMVTSNYRLSIKSQPEA